MILVDGVVQFARQPTVASGLLPQQIAGELVNKPVQRSLFRDFDNDLPNADHFSGIAVNREVVVDPRTGFASCGQNPADFEDRGIASGYQSFDAWGDLVRYRVPEKVPHRFAQVCGDRKAVHGSERVINGLIAQLIIQDREAKSGSMGKSSAQAASRNERVLFHHLECFVRWAVILFVHAFLRDHDSWHFRLSDPLARAASYDPTVSLTVHSVWKSESLRSPRQKYSGSCGSKRFSSPAPTHGRAAKGGHVEHRSTCFMPRGRVLYLGM